MNGRAPRAWPVLVLCGAGAIVLSWFVAQHSLFGARWTFELLLALWIPLWLAGAWAATQVRGRSAALLAILVIAAALRLTAASGSTPSVSNDLYRYGWDAHVELSGIDPYRYPPDAPQLRRLRTPPYFPNPAQCATTGAAPGCTSLNRPSVRTIYPPVAEAWFDVINLVDPGQGTRKWQLAGGAVDLAVVGLLMVGSSRLGRDPRRVAWYALSPLPVIEFAGNGHVDGLALLLLLAAFLALRRGRAFTAGALIGAAAMVKLYPGVALIGAWHRGRWRSLAAATAVAVLAYLPHVAVVGARVVGYLPGYLSEEHYGNGDRFLLLTLLPLRGHVAAGAAAAIVVATAGLAVRARWGPEATTAAVLSVALLVASPVQPWYAVGLAAIGILLSTPWLVLPALCAEPYYAAVILDSSHQVAIGRLCYGAAALTVAGLWLRSRQAACQPVERVAMSSTRL